MPFTPFHMGPGIFIKAILQGSFSLMVFGWAQIVMDIQPLFVLVSGEGQLHGFTHTYLGATLLAIFSTLTGKYLSEYGLLISGISRRQHIIKIAWPIATLSAFIGTYSHVVLDSLMHADMQPLYPWLTENELLGLVSVESIHMFCLLSASAGAVIYCLIQFIWCKRGKAGNDSND